MIIGTGTNACYLEDIDRVDTWDGDKGEPKHVIINTEWGAFGNKASEEPTPGGFILFEGRTGLHPHQVGPPGGRREPQPGPADIREDD